MSSYYYSREAGAEGQILTGEGTAPGVGLDTLLDRERPPLRAALAIGSALADLLCISLEDRMVHGDIRPAHVKIDTNGTVSLEGYGVQRRTTKAPEGKPDSHATDVYGLGVVLHSILSAEPLGNLPKEADAHDDEVVSRVLAMDFRQVQGKRWLEDVRKFLCQILAWTPADRPAPLDAANVLASVAAQCPGETLEAWAKRVNAAPSRAPAAAPTPVRAAAVEEDLGGPVALSGPLAKGGARQAPAAKGESTAFWSREKIAAMLAEDDDEPPLRQNVSVPKSEPRRAEPVRAAEPTFRMEEPARAEPPRRPEPARQPDPPRRPEPEPQRSRPPEPQRSEPPRPEPQRSQPEPQRSQASQASSPFANAKIEAADPFEQPEKKTSPMVWVAVVVVLLMLVCGGLTLGGGGLYWFIGTGTSTTAAQEAAEKAAKEAEEKAKEAEAKAKEAAEKATEEAGGDAAGDAGTEPKTETGPKSETKTEPKSETKATTPTTTTTKTTTTSPATPTKTTTTKTTTPTTKTTSTKTTTPKTTTTTTAAPPPSASFSVKFSAPGREGKLQCGDGQTAEFAGATTMTFESTTTCLVRIDLGKGAVQVSRTASVTCSEDAGKVTCSGN